MRSEQDAQFGQLLKQFRLQAGLSQAALAERAALAVAAVAALEQGRRRAPYAQTLHALAEALSLSRDERALLVGAARQPPTPRSTQSAPRFPSSNVPSPRTELIGRDRDIERLCALLTAPDPNARLVSLPGVGGVGKTSLALHVARRCQAAFKDGVWFIELASVTQPGLVDRVVAELLEAHESSGQSATEAVRSFLAPRHALLVLDNCEHVLDACARLVEVILDECPDVRLLTTSREPLLVRGEQQMRLAPLSVGADSGAAESPAVRLFLARAKSVAPDFTLTPGSGQAVRDLCVRLDGIPLALELAAARVRMLAPTQILARLDDSLDILAGADRLAPTRHQTLRAAMDWSYALLSPAEQAVFRRLSVFVGSFDLESAEVVCATSNSAGGGVLGVLSGLVDKSLVATLATLVGTADTTRFRLLEPVRQYAKDQLAGTGEELEVRRKHANVFVALAEQAAPELTRSSQAAWLERLEADLPNLRSALEWLWVEGDGSQFLQMALDLVAFFEVRGYLAEGRDWLELAQQRGSFAPHVRVQALMGLGRVAFWQVDLERAATVFQEAQALARDQDDQPSVALATTWLGAVRRRQARFAEAQALLEDTLRQHEARDEAASAAWALFNLAQIANRESGTAESVRLNEDALRRYRALGNVHLAAVISVLLAADLVTLGKLERVPGLLEDGLEALEVTRDRVFLSTGLLTLATIATHLGERVLVGQLLGCADSLNASLGVTLAPNARHYYAQLMSTAPEEAVHAGRRMSIGQVLSEVREMLRRVRARSTRAHSGGAAAEGLTPREQEVVQLLFRGLSDRQIASELDISPRTAGVHVRNVLAKLGVRSRWQVHNLRK